MSYVLIEHDLDIALRVVENVTVMHNGRVLKSGTPDEIENDAQVQAIYMGEQALMAWRPRPADPLAATGQGHRADPAPSTALDVYYGRAHALQGVSFELAHGVLGIVGRNGMGKTTLCNAITGMVRAQGSVRLAGEPILGLAPHQITRRGIAYVPQGRRVWPSLSVDETLRLVAQTPARGRACVRRCSRAWPSARATAARSCPAVSSRCWRSAARCCSSRSCW